jgi:hypothetical protein
MSVPVDAIGSQNLSYISQERTILNQVKLSGVEANGIVAVPSGFKSSQDTLQAINNTILRLMQTIGMVNENVSALKSPPLNADLEETVATLVESVNRVLMIINEVSNDDMATNKNSEAVKGSLCMLREIIESAVKTPDALNQESRDFSTLGIKLIHDGLINLDHKTLKEAISSNVDEAERVIKTITAALFETLPLCIDPNSGALVYTGKRLEDSGDDKASKVLTAMGEDLEKERTELEKRLGVAEQLISHSHRFIDSFMLSSEALNGEE